MTFGTSLRLAAGVFTILFLAACGNFTQTTSGKAYLERYAAQTGAAGVDARIDPEIRAAADVEPILAFPARVGIARIDEGMLTAIPAIEAETWLAMAERLGPDWGEFVPISPLIAALASQPLTKAQRDGFGCGPYNACIEQTVRNIRLAAARQHVDVVLIYEVIGTSETRSNPLALTWLTLVGFYIAPSQNIEADGFGQALLVDVRNGYTYGQASAVADDAAFTLSTLINSAEASRETLDEAKTAAAVELSREVELMARRLREELQGKRSGTAAAPTE